MLNRACICSVNHLGGTTANRRNQDTKSVCTISKVHVGADRAGPDAPCYLRSSRRNCAFLSERWIELAPLLLQQINAPSNVVGGLAKAQKRSLRQDALCGRRCGRQLEFARGLDDFPAAQWAGSAQPCQTPCGVGRWLSPLAAKRKECECAVFSRETEPLPPTGALPRCAVVVC